MERNKKIGLITIILALTLAAASLVFSSNPCHYETPLTSVLLNCIRIDLPDYTLFNEFAREPHVLTKYLLLACFILFAIGFLWLKGALSAPGGSMPKAQPRSSTKPVDE